MTDTTLAALRSKIEDKTARVGVVGLGYVGLPVACLLAQTGYTVTGIDIDAARVEKINNGISPIEGIEPGLGDLVAEVISSKQLQASTDATDLDEADVILISVQTPIEDHDHKPRYAHMQSALASIGQVMGQGTLVIIESTLAPGTMRDVIIPALEEHSGMIAGQGFYIGHCPERVTPGRLLRNLKTMNRVVGGLTPDIAEVMVTLYGHYVEGDLDMTDILTAETVKTAENAYRDVQIAFANELAMICEGLGGDFWKVRDLVNKVPGRNVLFAGAGVGGHCIPKDPWLLIANAGHDARLIPAARNVNRYMPGHIAQQTRDALASCGVKMEDATIAVLGYAYMENSDDDRDTPTAAYLQLIDGDDIRIHDPFVPAYQGDFDATIQGADAAVILVKHDEYVQKDWHTVLAQMRTPIIIDARHTLADDFTTENAVIRVIGRGIATEKEQADA